MSPRWEKRLRLPKSKGGAKICEKHEFIEAHFRDPEMSWEVDQALTQAKDDGKRMEARIQELGEEANNLEEALQKMEADRDALRAELDLVHGEIRADDERLYAAWVRIHGAPDDCANIGCDAPEWMADEILRLRAELERTKEKLERVRIASALLLAESDDVMDRYESRCPIQAGELQRAIDNCRSALERKAGA